MLGGQLVLVLARKAEGEFGNDMGGLSPVQPARPGNRRNGEEARLFSATHVPGCALCQMPSGRQTRALLRDGRCFRGRPAVNVITNITQNRAFENSPLCIDRGSHQGCEGGWGMTCNRSRLLARKIDQHADCRGSDGMAGPVAGERFIPGDGGYGGEVSAG